MRQNTHGDSWAHALLAGLAGAATATLLNESVRRVLDDAPRMEVLGRAAIRRGIRAAGLPRPPRNTLQPMALAGDIVSNTAYYSLVGCTAIGGNAMTRGAALGALAGIGAVAFPGVMGLPQWPTTRTPQTAVMSFGWYFAAGLAAGATMSYLEETNDSRQSAPADGPMHWREPDRTAIESQRRTESIYAVPT